MDLSGGDERRGDGGSHGHAGSGVEELTPADSGGGGNGLVIRGCSHGMCSSIASTGPTRLAGILRPQIGT